MTRHAIERVTTTSKIVDDYARVAYDALEHLFTERARLDGHRASTMSDGTPSGSGVSDPAGRIGTQRYECVELIEQIRDDINHLVTHTNDAIERARRALGHRAPRHEHQPVHELRCNGHIDPTCTQIASRQHHHITGETIDGFCVDCWQQLCRSCYTRPAETRRGGQCEACRRRELRAGAKETAA